VTSRDQLAVVLVGAIVVALIVFFFMIYPQIATPFMYG
jgi:hypothetical protein